MRTVIMFVSFSLMDIAVTNGKIYSDDTTKFLSVLLIVVMIMDVVDFFRGNR